MSTTERIYALLVDANPVPDPDALPFEVSPSAPHLELVDTGRIPMQTREEAVRPLSPEPPRRPGWVMALVAAVVVIVAVGLGALLLRGDGVQPVVDTPATTLPAVETTIPAADAAAQARIDTAIAKVESFYAALNAGDLDEIVALVSPDVADLAMWEGNIVAAEQHPFVVNDCAAPGVAEGRIRVECSIVFPDPVWELLSVSELVAPWDVYDDGRMAWQPFRGGDFTQANRAYRDYLLAHRPDEYAELCDPSRHEFGTVNFDGGIAITAECLRLELSVADQVVEWIEAGRPSP